MTERRFDAPTSFNPARPKSHLDAALDTFDTEQRAASKAGPPACAFAVREGAGVARGLPARTLDEAHARAEEQRHKDAQAGPPACAAYLRGR